jgi:hypothetical protein
MHHCISALNCTLYNLDRSGRATGDLESGTILAKSMADLRSDLSRQDLQHDALLRQIAACQDIKERCCFSHLAYSYRVPALHYIQSCPAEVV